MKIENTRCGGFCFAFQAMRNPMESWDKSDSYFDDNDDFVLGPKDTELALKLCKGGSEHHKFLRGINVGVTITLPLYIWTEWDTYKVGVSRNSCSTMHTLGKRALVRDDFQDGAVLPDTLETLNGLAKMFQETKDFEYRRRMKQYLPSGYLLKSDVDMNYEVCLNMFRQRKDHRLSEWAYTGKQNTDSICNWITTLPYMYDILKHIGEIP